MSAIVYAMMILIPRHQQAPVVMLTVLGFLSYQHLYAMIYNFGDYQMDITSYTMLLVCKLSALAYCYQDGATDAEKLNQDQKDRMVINLPTPLEMASYVWYCQACALGVFFEFTDYKRWVERTHEYKDVPCPIAASLKWLAKGVFCLAFYTVIAPYCNVEMCWSEKFLEFAYAFRIVYYFFAMTFKRLFYYTPFSMTTGAIIASGLGYNGMEKGEHKWDKIIGVYIWEIETASSPIEMLRFWNHQVHLWLKFYIMGRLAKPGKRPGMFENMVTFLVSAFWHGFYPFYYVMFFFAGVLSEVSKDIFKARFMFSFIPEALRPVFGNIFAMLAMNYLGILQCALTFENGGRFLKATWALIPVGLILILGLSRSLGLVRMAQKLEAASKKPESISATSTAAVDDSTKEKTN